MFDMDTSKIKGILNGCTKPYVIVLIGPPLSGKDTFIKNLNMDDLIKISRDDILLDVWGSDNYDEAFRGVNQKIVDKKLNELLVETGKSFNNAVINMTNMSSKRRKYNLSFFKNHIKIGVIFPILSEDEYKTRNNKRKSEENKWIPEHILKSMISSYQPINMESEGFDKVISI